jgi:8-oxo-dGTP pyrophosphatase MutT (NUDIX family)
LRQAVGRPAVRAVAPDARRASVAAVLTPSEAGADLWFILRSVREGDPWSGQIGFPGGRMDAGDPDPLHTAIRETQEELGLALSRSELLGELDDLAPITGLQRLVVHPYVFWRSGLGELAPNPAEVAAVFPVGLEDLVAGVSRTRFVLDWKGESHELPCVEVPTPLGTARLWGMTLRIVDDLLHRLDGRGIGLDRLVDPLRGA